MQLNGGTRKYYRRKCTPMLPTTYVYHLLLNTMSRVYKIIVRQLISTDGFDEVSSHWSWHDVFRRSGFRRWLSVLSLLLRCFVFRLTLFKLDMLMFVLHNTIGVHVGTLSIIIFLHKLIGPFPQLRHIGISNVFVHSIVLLCHVARWCRLIYAYGL